MDSGQRRRPSASPARLALLALANGLVLLVLARLLWPGDAAGRAPEAQPMAGAATAGAAHDATAVTHALPGARPVARPGDRPGGGLSSRDAAAERAGGAGASGELQALAPRLRAVIADALAEARAAARAAARPPAGEFTVALCVRQRAAGGGAPQTLAFSADRALAPASNMKLVTSAAALVALGPAWQFETPVELGGPVSAGTLHGDLILRAGADPFYTRPAPAADGADRAKRASGVNGAWASASQEGALAPHLAPLLAALRQRGIRRIAGDIVLDEGSFEAPGPAPGWPGEVQHVREYCALAAGFSANGGCLNASLRPGLPGGPATVSVQPAAHGLEQQIAVTTGALRSTLRVAVEARGGRVLVKGSLPADVSLWQARCAHPDPVALFGAALCGSLEEAGMALGGSWRRGSPPERGPPLVTLTSSLAACLVPITTDSNNAVSEQVLLALGRAREGVGSRAAGARACASILEQLGVSAAGFIQADGSGLSRNNRVSARQLVALLDAVMARGGTTAHEFRASLALAGRTGTLAQRMGSGPAAGRVRAKTGWIEGASALSGLVEMEDGRRRVFSILVSYPRIQGLNRRVWKPMQDEICGILAGEEEG